MAWHVMRVIFSNENTLWIGGVIIGGVIMRNLAPSIGEVRQRHSAADAALRHYGACVILEVNTVIVSAD